MTHFWGWCRDIDVTRWYEEGSRVAVYESFKPSVTELVAQDGQVFGIPYLTYPGRACKDGQAQT